MPWGPPSAQRVSLWNEPSRIKLSLPEDYTRGNGVRVSADIAQKPGRFLQHFVHHLKIFQVLIWKIRSGGSWIQELMEDFPKLQSVRSQILGFSSQNIRHLRYKCTLEEDLILLS